MPYCGILDSGANPNFKSYSTVMAPTYLKNSVPDMRSSRSFLVFSVS